ncbi:hypothetical protein IWX90DRAFT_439911 [Phyllosticta citrichinensis]|uniref:Secreted peptide n=1 Tax=Phyllosticta citrichinensis TaxID=1130410 RepID=A0ABR1XK62_9PEZI
MGHRRRLGQTFLFCFLSSSLPFALPLLLVFYLDSHRLGRTSRHVSGLSLVVLLNAWIGRWLVIFCGSSKTLFCLLTFAFFLLFWFSFCRHGVLRMVD